MQSTEPTWAALVPELACADVDTSIGFYRDILGFTVRFARPGFAYVELGQAQIMLEAEAQSWMVAEMTPPYGRGINLQIEAASVDALHKRLVTAGVRLFRPPADTWYRDGDIEHGQRELLVQDPDGYLLRFAEILGTRPA